MNTPSFIYFDLGNVILNFSHQRACRQMAEVAGLSQARVWSVVFDGKLQHRYESGEIDTAEFFESFCQATGTQPDRQQLAEASSDIFWANRPLIPIIAQLRAASFPIGILSNTCPAHWRFICQRFTVIRQYFPTAVLSFEVGSMKPEPVIYRHAISRAGVAAEQIFYVDDRQEHVAAARLSGIDAHLYESACGVYRLLLERGVRINL
jgi:putative hydrolase of the HAD superfamily